MTGHAKFAPSSAHRWLNCTASVDAASRYPDPPSEAAQEGSAAHFLLERCLVDGGEPAGHLGRAILVREGAVERRFVVDRDMARDVALGVSTVREIASHPGTSCVEARVDLSVVDAGAFGTADLWHWGQDGVLTVADFKYGRGDVVVEENDQLMLYAAGVWEMFAGAERARSVGAALLRQVDLVVVQPRSVAATPRVKRWSFPASRVGEVIERAIGAVAEARRGPQFVAGPWCRHCPALGECPATQPGGHLSETLQSADMTVLDAVHVLRHKDVLEKIVARAEKTLLDAMLAGYRSEQFRLVTKTKHRQWRDADLARERVAEAFGVAALEPPTPAGTDRLGAEGKRITADLAWAPPGEPAIGRNDDKRSPYLPRTAVEMFGGTK